MPLGANTRFEGSSHQLFAGEEDVPCGEVAVHEALRLEVHHSGSDLRRPQVEVALHRDPLRVVEQVVEQRTQIDQLLNLGTQQRTYRCLHDKVRRCMCVCWCVSTRVLILMIHT